MKLIASSGSRKAKMHLRSIKGFEKNYKIKFPSKQLNIKNFYLTTKNYISPDREEGGIWGPKGGASSVTGRQSLESLIRHRPCRC